MHNTVRLWHVAGGDEFFGQVVDLAVRPLTVPGQERERRFRRQLVSLDQDADRDADGSVGGKCVLQLGDFAPISLAPIGLPAEVPRGRPTLVNRHSVSSRPARISAPRQPRCDDSRLAPTFVSSMSVDPFVGWSSAGRRNGILNAFTFPGEANHPNGGLA